MQLPIPLRGDVLKEPLFRSCVPGVMMGATPFNRLAFHSSVSKLAIRVGRLLGVENSVSFYALRHVARHATKGCSRNPPSRCQNFKRSKTWKISFNAIYEFQ